MITCMYYAKTIAKLYMYIYILRASLCACVHQCYVYYWPCLLQGLVQRAECLSLFDPNISPRTFAIVAEKWLTVYTHILCTPHSYYTLPPPPLHVPLPTQPSHPTLNSLHAPTLKNTSTYVYTVALLIHNHYTDACVAASIRQASHCTYTHVHVYIQYMYTQS